MTKPLSRKELADYLGLTEATLAQMATRGTGPKFSKLNDRLVRYRLEDVEAWLEENLMIDTKTKAS